MSIELWGGVLEIMYSCDEPENLPEKIKNLRKKLEILEGSKNQDEIVANFIFTLEEINYLNSPLLDEIHKTISEKNPMLHAFKYEKEKAIKFYVERGLEIHGSEVIEYCSENKSLAKIIDILISYNQYLSIIINEDLAELCICGPLIKYKEFYGNNFDCEFYYGKEGLDFLEMSLKNICETCHDNYKMSIKNVTFCPDISEQYGNYSKKPWFSITYEDCDEDSDKKEKYFEPFHMGACQFQYLENTEHNCKCWETYLRERKPILEKLLEERHVCDCTEWCGNISEK